LNLISHIFTLSSFVIKQRWLLLFVFLLQCTPKITPFKAPIDEPENFSDYGTASIDQNNLPDKWWLVFEDPQLNALMDSAFANNMDLTSTWFQLIQAQNIRKARSTFLIPDLEFGARTAISRPQPDFAGGENTQLGVSTSYEVDLWGRIRASVQAEDFRLQASYFDYQAAAITLSAQVATVWFQLITTQKQLNLAQQQIENNESIIQLIKARFGAGQIKGVDILRQQQILEATKDQKIVYEINLTVLKNQLAVLIGKPPQNIEVEERAILPNLPIKPEVGLPLELIRRRPDIQSAYSSLMAADRDMAVAVRNKFPRLSFNLSTQARSNTYSELFNDWAYTLGANLVAPIFNWGRLRAEVNRAEAVKNGQLYFYGQSVLLAFQEVENALIQEQKQLERIDVLETRLDLADKIFKQLRIEFINGFTPYLDVLLSLNEQQQLQRDMLDAQQTLYEVRISLYRALAGSFETQRAQNIETDNLD